MRYHETRYPTDLYVEKINGWEKLCRTPNKSWRKHMTKQERYGADVIRYWRDWEGAKKTEITNNDYRFNKWQKTRLNYFTLPLYYVQGGYRFINISKSFPCGFNMAFQPMSLAEVHKMEGIVIGKKKKKGKKKSK